MIQIIDFRFELLFGSVVLVSAVALVAAFALGLSGKRVAASRLLKALAAGFAVYLSVVFLVAALTPQKSVAMNSNLCSDEMCFAVVDVKTMRQIGPKNQAVYAKGIFYAVTIRVSNHGRGKAQSEKGLRALLWSPERDYAVSPEGRNAWDAIHPDNRPLTARVPAGDSFLSDQIFDVPSEDQRFGLVLTNGFTPGFFVIGECPLFHQPAMLRFSR